MEKNASLAFISKLSAKVFFLKVNYSFKLVLFLIWPIRGDLFSYPMKCYFI